MTTTDPRGETEHPTEWTHCAGRLAVAHPRTRMVQGRCPVCGEPDFVFCQVVIGEQHGEPVACGAVEAIHGDGLGKIGGHAFQRNAQRCEAQDKHRWRCVLVAGHPGKHETPVKGRHGWVRQPFTAVDFGRQEERR